MDEQKGMPQCNWCKGNKQADWTLIYGELPTHDYTFCCTEHIPAVIEEISNGKKGEVKALYLTKWNTKGEYDPAWERNWSDFYRKTVGMPKDDTPLFLRALNRSLDNIL